MLRTYPNVCNIDSVPREASYYLRPVTSLIEGDVLPSISPKKTLALVNCTVVVTKVIISIRVRLIC